jgi:hypothetical protein
VRVLYCGECGCCAGALPRGWAAFLSEDPDGIDEPGIAVYCPVCAAREFGYRPDVAERYVRAWEPLPAETPRRVEGA